MWLNMFLILLGLVLLERGAAWFVKGNSVLVRKFKIPELTIGLTIVAFGTSAPELVVNTFAASAGNPGKESQNLLVNPIYCNVHRAKEVN